MGIEILKARLREQRNPHDAFHMEKYMKDQFMFLGIRTPERKKILRDHLKAYGADPLPDAISLYGEPEREMKYAAAEILFRYEKTLSQEDLPDLLRLALTDPWWDTIDIFAPRIFGPMALRDAQVKEKVRSLIYSENIWEKRISILFQLKYREKTDRDFLTEAVLKNADTGEFFVNKAIGWILREYAKTDPQFVLHFLSAHRLSPLSEREAKKHLKLTDVVK